MKKKILILCLAIVIIFSATLPISAVSGNVFLRNRAAGKKVALTFDDGPHPIYTRRILDVLKEYGVTATFFVIGQNIENYPNAFEVLLESGCEIGSHTYSHRNIRNMNETELTCEIEKNEIVMAKYTDRRFSLLRPPEGSYGSQLERVSIKKGYNVILWSIDTLDWAHTPADRMASKVLESVSDGDIILMHDYVSGRFSACEALRIIIPELISRGYEFVSVSELIGEE